MIRLRLVLRVLAGLVPAIGLVSFASTSVADGTDRGPNVVLIMTDDQAYGDLGFHGNEKIDTPVLDSLASQSVRFDHFLVCPYCTTFLAGFGLGKPVMVSHLTPAA